MNMENLLGNKSGNKSIEGQSNPVIEDVEIVLENSENSEDLESAIKAFQDAEKRFGEIRENAEKLKDEVPEMFSKIKTANNAIMAFSNIRESDEKTKEKFILTYLGVLNREIDSIEELVEENAEKLELKENNEAEKKVESSSDFEKEKSEIVSKFSTVEYKFEKLKNSLAEDQRSILEKILASGDKIIEEFNGLVKTEALEEVLGQLEEKQRELESVIASLSKRVGDMEGTENIPDEETEKESGDSNQPSAEEPAEEIPKNQNQHVVDFTSDSAQSEALAKEGGDTGGPESAEEKTENPEEKSSYEIARAESLAIKQQYQEKEKEYKTSLDAFYREQQNKSSAFNKIKRFFGFGISAPDLPEDLKKEQNEVRDLKRQYAQKLNLALRERSTKAYAKETGGEVKYEIKKNKEYDENASQTKMAFAQKFVVRPNQELLKQQEVYLLSEKAREQRDRILKVIGQHKKTVMFGAGAIALVGGGLPAYLAALTAGLGAKEFTQKGVDRAVGNINALKQAFSINDLERLEKELLEAEIIKNAKLRNQKIVTTGAALVAGGLSHNYGPDMDGLFSSNVTTENTNVAVENIKETVNEGLDRVTKEATKILETLKEINGNNGSESATMVDLTTEDLSVGAEAIVSEKIETQVLGKISIPNYSMGNSSEVFHTNISDLKIVAEGDIPTQYLKDIEQSIRMSSSDLLQANPHTPIEKVSEYVFEKLTKRFGEEDWWQDLKVSEIKIGDIEQVSASGEVSPESATESTETVIENEVSEIVPATPETISSEHIYTVQKDDTLWHIMKKEYSHLLEDLSDGQKNILLDKLFDNVRFNPDLLESLNLKKNDIDLIYPNEELNLYETGKELERLVELEKGDLVKEVPASGRLEVQVELNKEGGDEIPIHFEKQNSDISFTQAPEIYKPIGEDIMSTPMPLEQVASGGEYFVLPEVGPDTPNIFSTKEYQAFAIDTFGSERNLNSALVGAVKGIESEAYGFFESASDFDSPYKLVGNMTIKEFDDFLLNDKQGILQAFAEKGLTNVKYEAYLELLKFTQQLKESGLPYVAETKVSDLFSRYVVEAKAQQLNNYV